MTAHITKTKDGYILEVSDTPRAADAFSKIFVSDKREARCIAKAYGAQPWNF
jgi:hypothetical protein